MENNYEEKNFVEMGMKEMGNTIGVSMEVISNPVTVLNKRIRPLLLEMIGNKIYRPLMSPHRIR